MDIANIQQHLRDWYSSIKEMILNHISRPTPIVLTSVSGSLLILLLWRSRQKEPRNLPPHPGGWPLLGNILELSQTNMPQDLIRLQKKYNLPDIYTLVMTPGLSMIIVNSYDAIKDGLVKQGDLFARRPQSLALEVMNFKDEIVYKDYRDPTWRERKSFIVSALRNAGISTRASTERKIMDQFSRLEDYLEPYKLEGHAVDLEDIFPLLAASVIFRILFDKVYDLDDPELLHRTELVKKWYLGLGSGALVDMLHPWLVKLFCGRIAKTLYNTTEDVRVFVRQEIKEHQETLDPDNPRDFLDLYISKHEELDIEMLANLAFALLPDAIHTMGGFFNWIILYMGLHTNVQQKVQAEVDEVTGGNRSVSWADKPQMPYTEAVMMEIMRMAIPLALTSPHCILNEGYFRGYFFPSEMPVVFNLYAAMRDPAYFPDPDVFKPERFIDQSGCLAMNEAWIPFGMGRRACVGEQLVKIELFLFLANFPGRYDISFPADAPLPSTEPTASSISRLPNPFKFIIKSRQ